MLGKFTIVPHSIQCSWFSDFYTYGTGKKVRDFCGSREPGKQPLNQLISTKARFSKCPVCYYILRHFPINPQWDTKHGGRLKFMESTLPTCYGIIYWNRNQNLLHGDILTPFVSVERSFEYLSGSGLIGFGFFTCWRGWDDSTYVLESLQKFLEKRVSFWTFDIINPFTSSLYVLYNHFSLHMFVFQVLCGSTN